MFSEINYVFYDCIYYFIFQEFKVLINFIYIYIYLFIIIYIYRKMYFLLFFHFVIYFQNIISVSFYSLFY
jgi:hypothetical protein